jgi:hypothetical protein
MQENHMQKCQNKGSKPSKKGKEKSDDPSFTCVGAIVGRVSAQGETLGTVG